MFSNFKQGLLSCFRWYKLVWNDRQYDYIYFFLLLQKKLELMEKYFYTNANFLGKEKEAKKIKIARFCVNRLIKDDYNVYKEHEKKYGELEWDFDRTMNSFLKYSKVKTKKEEREANKSFNRCTKHEDYLRNQDLDYLFKIIRKHILKWWD